MEFEANIARKVGDVSLLRVEAEKSRRAAEIGERSGLFSVPHVIALDASRSTLEFERIPDLTTFIRFAASRGPECAKLARRAGRAVARIHLDLRLEESMRVPLPDEWSSPNEESVWLHGDLTANNICIDPNSMEIVIVDWSAAPLVGRRATVGPRSFDVLCFIRHVMMGAAWHQVLGWQGRSLCDQFITGYVKEFGSPFETDSWNRHCALLNAFSDTVVQSRIARAPIYARLGKALAQRALIRGWYRYRPPEGCLVDSGRA